jgi:hypothetical protein
MQSISPEAPKPPAAKPSAAPVDSGFAGRLRAAAELLEAVAANRALLAGLPEEERTRLLQAAGQVSRPDAVDRRRLVKAT